MTIGEGAKILAHVVINGYTTIGDEAVIYPFASIGAPSQDRKAGEEIAYTTIGARTVVREYVSIHRATGEGQTTSVGTDGLLLAYSHIAHNCAIGNFVTMSNLAQLAGHCTVGDYAVIGGMAGVPPYFLIEGNPAEVYGLNSTGLRRHGFGQDVLHELKEAYKTIYRSDRNLSQAVVTLRETVTTDEGRSLLAFLETESNRGIMK